MIWTEHIKVEKWWKFKKAKFHINKLINTIEETDTVIKPIFSYSDSIRSISSELTTTTCENSFRLDWNCIENTIDDSTYKLLAYAPYNGYDINISNKEEWFKKSFMMYWSWTTIFPPFNAFNQVMYSDTADRWEPIVYSWSFLSLNWWCSTDSSIVNFLIGVITHTTDKKCNLNLYWYNFNKYNHIIKDSNNNVNWVYIDNYSNDSYLMYNLSNISWDFAIEMNVRIPNDSAKHYLLNWSDLWLFINNWKLYYVGMSADNWIQLIKGSFNKIYLIKENWEIYLSVWNYSSKVNTNIKHSWNISELVIWAYKINQNQFNLQFNDIIDYIKIYTKSSVWTTGWSIDWTIEWSIGLSDD